jgi:hypothetical protein
VIRHKVRAQVDPLVEYLHDEAAGGIVLLVAAIAALVWANSPASDAYFDRWHAHVDVGIELDLHDWVNDGLMALFFFVVGLETKRELVVGELRGPRAAVLPALAASAGVALPPLLFFAFTAGSDAAAGWATRRTARSPRPWWPACWSASRSASAPPPGWRCARASARCPTAWPSATWSARARWPASASPCRSSSPGSRSTTRS